MIFSMRLSIKGNLWWLHRNRVTAIYKINNIQNCHEQAAQVLPSFYNSNKFEKTSQNEPNVLKYLMEEMMSAIKSYT
jgi:hypothetical protein